MSNNTGFSGSRYAPMGCVQFTSVFIDYAYKSLAALTALPLIGSGYANQSAFITLLAIAYTLPFVFSGGLAGFAADRIAKNRLLIWVKAAELLLLFWAVGAVAYAPEWGTAPMISAVLLLSLQSMFLSPGFNGLIPELFGQSGASEANGLTGMVSSVAVIFGASAGFALPAIFGGDYTLSALCLLPMSAIGLICACCIPKSQAGNPKLKLSPVWLFGQFRDAWRLHLDRSLFFAICGDAFFCALSTAVLSILLVFLINGLGFQPDETLAIGLTQLMLGLGVGLGSLTAGKLSKGNIEVGLVPYGLLGMMAMLFLIPLFPGPSFTLFGLKVLPFLLIWLFGLGFSGGLFIVPLRAYTQCRASESNRGTVLAGANIICFGAMLAASIGIFYLTSGIPANQTGLWSGVTEWIQKGCLQWSPMPIFFVWAIGSAGAALFAVIRIPETGIRFTVLFMTHLLYQIRERRVGDIPETGPCLIIANHVTLLDGLLISTLTSRPIRFLMHEDFYRQPFIHPFAKIAGFIEVPKDSSSGMGYERLAQIVRECLNRGELLCIFSEAKLTRGGVFHALRVGFRNLLKDYGDVPIVPVNLSFPWGSLFSKYYGDGRISLRMPFKLPYSVNLTVGKPVAAKSVTPFALRRIISELGADTENQPRRKERPLHYRFAKVASRNPFKVIITESSGKIIRNYQLWVGALLLSREIRRKTDNQYVAILLPNCIAAAVGILGTLMADKIPAVLNFTASRDSLRHSLEKIGHPRIITSRLFIHKMNFEPLDNMWFLEDAVSIIPKWKKIFAAIATFSIPYPMLMRWISPLSHRDVRRPGVILFSSGSSGQPKAVSLSHHNLNENVYAMLSAMGWRTTDKMTGSLPLFHSFGFTTGFWLPLLTLSPVGYVHSPLDGVAVGDLIEKLGLTILLATPTFLQTYCRKIPSEKLRTIRLVVVGGERMRQDIAEAFEAKFGIAPIEGYGATELSPVATINFSRDNDLDDFSARPGKKGSIGPALPNLCVKTADPVTFDPLEENEEGLLMIKGPSVMTGYLDDPEMTAKVIIDGWYNTGDLARIDADGYIFITGRLSRFSKIGGEMVPHEKVEEILLRHSPEGERTVAVTSASDPDKGERLIILYTPHFPLSPEEMINTLRDAKLPNLWIPKIKDILPTAQIPLLGSGKLDLAALKTLVK